MTVSNNFRFFFLYFIFFHDPTIKRKRFELGILSGVSVFAEISVPLYHDQIDSLTYQSGHS